MATSERWEKLYEARRRRKYLQDATEKADLWVTIWNSRFQSASTASDNDLGWQIINHGSRVVPFGCMFVGLDTKKTKNVDPRGDIKWAEMAEMFPVESLQQLSQTFPSALLVDAAGAIVGENPDVPPRDPVVGYQAGVSFRDHGSYWTNEDVEEDTQQNKLYTRGFENALSWWLLMHGKNPGAYLDYAVDLDNIIQQINVAEITGVDVNDRVVGSGGGGFSADDFTGTPAGGAFDQFDQYKQYLPYAAAGAVVLFALMRRRGRQPSGG